MLNFNPACSACLLSLLLGLGDKSANALAGLVNSSDSSSSSDVSVFFKALKFEYFLSNRMNLSNALEVLGSMDCSSSIGTCLLEPMKENSFSGSGVVLSEVCLTLGR